MKKLFIVFGICFLLAAMPIGLSVSAPTMKLGTRLSKILSFEDPEPIIGPLPPKDPPEWANGEFVGVWGLDIWGEWHIPAGWMVGYYKRTTSWGYFYAGFADFGEENATWYIQGYFLGPFLLGSLGGDQYANDTLCVGIGRYNDTDYHWRAMGEIGPTFFAEGEHEQY
jgi:hypothetical protein